jgi:hypothetical protein
VSKRQWAEAVDANAEIKHLTAQLASAQERLSVYEAVPRQEPHEIVRYKASGGQAIAVACLSDVHMEERVDPSDVPGVHNQYSPDICRRRLEQFAQRVVLLTESQRHLAQIDDLCLFLGGDLITGHLHDDQKESNYMLPLPALLFALREINSVIAHLLEHGGFERIVIPCCYGNHGRTTKKPRAKTAAETNYEWMLYNLLVQHWADEPRIEWHVASGGMLYIDLMGHVCRFTHGDFMTYNGGTGGASVPIMRAVSDWDKAQPAALTFMGHFHTARDFGRIILNGSVMGYNAYALSIHAAYERPRQQYVLIDSRRGKSLVADIFCDYMPKGDKS